MRTTKPGEPAFWIGEAPEYPGHPVTCALVIMLAYPGADLPMAWSRTEHGWYICEGELDTPTAGGALSEGCALIRFVLDGKMTVDEALAWGMRPYSAGGHKDKIAAGVAQAERMLPRLRVALLSARVRARLGKPGPGPGDGAWCIVDVDVLSDAAEPCSVQWVRMYGDEPSDPRTATGATVEDCLRKVLAHEDAMDRKGAEG